MGPREFAEAVVNDARFHDLSYVDQVRARQQLMDNIKKQDTEFRSRDQSERIAYERAFMTTMPSSLLRLTENPEAMTDQERYALQRAMDMSAVRSTGEATLGFADGWMDGAASAQGLLGRLSRRLTDEMIQLEARAGGNQAQGRLMEEQFDNPAMRDARLYGEIINQYYSPEGMADYKLGKGLLRGVNGVSELAMMAATYGSASPVGTSIAKGAEGLLTGWIPRLTNALNMGVKGGTIMRWGLQAATETLGYVGEETVMDLLEGRMSEENYGEHWLETLPGNLQRGLGFFVLGEAMGGIIGRSVRGLAKGVTGLDVKQKVNYLNKLSSGDLGDEIARTISYGDEAGFKALTDTIREFGGEDAVRIAQRAKNRIETFRILGQEVIDDFEATKQMLKSEYNFEFKGNTITKIGDETVNIKFKDQIDMMASIRKNFENSANARLTEASKIAGSRTGKIEVGVDFTGDIQKIKSSPNRLVRAFTGEGGVIDRKLVEDVVRGSDEALSVRSVGDFDPNVRSKGEIVIPEKIDLKSKTAISDLAKSFRDQLDFNGVKVGKASIDITNYVENARYGSQWDDASLNNLDSVSRTWVKADGGYTVRYKDGTTARGTLEQVGELGHFKTQSLEDINERLSRDFGSGIKLNDGKVQLITDGKVVNEYDNLEDLWFANQPMMPKKNFSDAPAFIDMSGTNPRMERTIKTGNAATVIRELNNFENSWRKSIDGEKTFTRVTKNGSEVTVIPKDRLYRVKLGDSGITRFFDNADDAKKFLNQDLKRFDNYYDQLINQYGLELRPLKAGGFQVFGSSLPDKVVYFKKLDDVKKYIGKLDEGLVNIKPMSGLTDVEEIRMVKDSVIPEFDGWKKEIGKFDQKAAARMKAGLSLDAFYNNHVGSIHNLVRKMDIPEVSKAYQDLIGRSQRFNAEANKLAGLYRRLFQGFDRMDVHVMGKIMLEEVNPREWAGLARTAGVELDNVKWAEMESVMMEVRSILDDLGARFGIRAEDFITNYMPRIKEIELGDIRAEHLADHDFVRQVMDPHGKFGQMDPWFEHLRVEDLYSAKLSSDVESILNIYTRVGLRKEYLGDAIQKFNDVVEAGVNGKQITEATSQRLRVFENVIAGRFADQRAAEQYVRKMSRNHRWAAEKGFDNIEKSLQDFTPAEIRKYERILNADLGRGLSTFQTAALMSAKLWMPIRNIVQVNHIGALYGNTRVLHSIDEILKDPQKYWEKAFNQGLLQSRSPKDISTFLSWLNNVNRAGTNWFKNSDDMTRIVAMVSVEGEMDELIAKVAAGKMTPDRFMKKSFASAFDTGTQEQLAKLLASGDIDSAKTLMTRNITQFTMYDYAKHQKPVAMQHALGRALLSYSTYPQQFAEMFGRMVKTNPLVGARLVTNMAVLSFVYNDVLGLQGYEGNPLKAMMFVGGPLAAGGMDIFRGITQGVSNVMRADTELLTKVNRLGKLGWSIAQDGARVVVPFNWYPQRFMGGVHALDQGEYYTSLLQFAGLNVNSDAVFPNVDLGSIVENFYDL